MHAIIRELNAPSPYTFLSIFMRYQHFSWSVEVNVAICRAWTDGNDRMTDHSDLAHALSENKYTVF